METPESKEDPTLRVIGEAAEWLVRLDDPQVADEVRRSYLRWLRDSPAHAEAVSSMVRIRASFADACDALRQDLAETHLDNDGEGTGGIARSALSLTYLQHVRKQHFRIKLALGTVAILAVAVCVLLKDMMSLGVAGLSVLVLSLVVCKEFVVGYRISRGFFGNTASEVRDFLQFVVENADDIDFTDDDGKRRPTLLSCRERSAVSAGEIPAGVTAK